METASSRQRRTKGWRRFLLGLSLIGSAANVCASAVAASRRKKATVIASSSSPSAKPIENTGTGTFPESNGVHWWHLKASHDVGDGYRYDDDTDEKEDEESTAYRYHRDQYEIASRANAIKRAPWRRPSDRGFQLVSGIGLGLGLGLQVPAAKRLIVTGAVALFVANRLHKLQTSEPVRRSLYFWHHAGPIVAHYKFARWWLTVSKADRQKRDLVFESLHNRYAQPALDLVLHLTGLYVKMGQILSSRPDFMPPQYVQRFTELQDNIPQWDTHAVQRMAVEALQNECPAFFADYEDLILDPVALGSASIGQVHRAVLRRRRGRTTSSTTTNSGVGNTSTRSSSSDPPSKEVAVKIMHRGVKAKFQADFQVFRWLCRVAIPSWRGVLDALEKQVMTEFDYRNEAEALKEVRNNMLNSPYRNRVCVPEPMEELCCEHVLVMEMLHGKKLIDSIRDQLTAAVSGNEEKATQFLAQRRREIITGEDWGSKEILRTSVTFFGKLKLLFLFDKCRRVIDLLVDVHGYQIFRTGTWNGDPHFGNCLQLDDGRLGLIDYGQTRRIDSEQRMAFAQIIVALNEIRKHEGVLPHGTTLFNVGAVASAMRNAGFATRDNGDDEMMTQYARLFFDSDEEGEKQGFTIPQEYFVSLMDVNPLVAIPDSAIFVGRTSLMFRGMGSAIGSGQIRTATWWHKHAEVAVKDAVD